jgi:hypothetical protein
VPSPTAAASTEQGNLPVTSHWNQSFTKLLLLLTGLQSLLVLLQGAKPSCCP